MATEGAVGAELAVWPSTALRQDEGRGRLRHSLTIKPPHSAPTTLLPPHHHPPSLSILLKHRSLLASIRIEPQILPRNKRLHRNHIPDVPRHNVGHDHINILLREPHNLPSHINRRMHRISPRPKPLIRRSNLHSPQPPVSVANKIVPIAVSPGLRNNHPHPHRLPQKIQLRKLPHPLRRQPLLFPQRLCSRGITQYRHVILKPAFFAACHPARACRRISVLACAANAAARLQLLLPTTALLALLLPPTRPIPIIRHRHQIPNQHTHPKSPMSSPVSLVIPNRFLKVPVRNLPFVIPHCRSGEACHLAASDRRKPRPISSLSVPKSEARSSEHQKK